MHLLLGDITYINLTVQTGAIIFAYYSALIELVLPCAGHQTIPTKNKQTKTAPKTITPRLLGGLLAQPKVSGYYCGFNICSLRLLSIGFMCIVNRF
jgi:hypothetical protein